MAAGTLSPLLLRRVLLPHIRRVHALKESTPAFHTHANVPATPNVPGSWLIGTWRGEGKGVYPTIQDFTYTEQITFWANPGTKYLFYTQNTWNPAKSYAPFHAESGFLRILGPIPGKEGKIKCELVLAQPNGLASVEEGELDNEGRMFKIEMTGGARASTAKAPFVTGTRRTYTLEKGASENDAPTLHYTMDMKTTTTLELTHHLEARLKKMV